MTSRPGARPPDPVEPEEPEELAVVGETVLSVPDAGQAGEHTVMVPRQSGPATDGTVVVRSRGGAPGQVMAEPVLRPRPRVPHPDGVVTGPARQPAEPADADAGAEPGRPRYTARPVPEPPSGPGVLLPGPPVLRGPATRMPSVAAATRRSARVGLVVWVAVSVVSVAAAVWLVLVLFGG